MRVLRTFSGYLRPYRTQVVLLILGLVLDVAFNAVMAFAFKYLIDDALPRHDSRLLWTIIAVMAAAVVIASVAAIGRDYLYAHLGAKVMNDLRLRMFEHLQRLSADFHGRARVGDVMARFTTDIGAVNTAVVSALPETVLSLLGIVVYTLLLFSLQPGLAVVAVMGFPALLIGPRLLAPRAEAESVRVLDVEGGVASTIQESLTTHSVIRAFGLGGEQVSSFGAKLEELYGRSLRFNVLSYLVERTPNVAFLALQVAILAVGSVRVFRGDFPVGTLVAFNAILLSLSVAITSLTRILPALLIASGGIDRIDRLLGEESPVRDDPGAEALAPLEDAMSFHDVTFSYEGAAKHLDGVSLTIRCRTKAAFVGTSGSGKSTAVSLLMRFFDPQSGTIAFDGKDIRAVTQASLRAQMGVVLQESLLFNTTIRENIRMGRLDASDEEIEAAAQAAEIEAVIKALPEGYDTLVGERGGRLSGGQRQRIAIARAIVRNPAVLVLDEATSALDPGTEGAVEATIERLAADRTVVAVTHKLASVVGYDRIFVFHQGRLVEEGTHEDLLARGGQYSQLWEKQSGVAVTSDGRLASVTARYLRSVPVLSDLSDAAYTRLCRLFVTEHFPENRVVIYEGDRMAEKFYVIARGRIAITASRGGAEERNIAVLEQGDYFGEIALVKDVPRTATVTTLTPSILLTLRRAQFLDLLQTEPGIEQEVSRQLRERSAELDKAHL
ncbi:MAG: ABC transporter transmembrane domain-containing protein [Acidimicrobiales bacterium]